MKLLQTPLKVPQEPAEGLGKNKPISIYLFAGIRKSSYNCYPSEKVVVVEKGLYVIDIDDIENLVFIKEECENLIVVNDGGELARHISQNRKSDILQWPIDAH